MLAKTNYIVECPYCQKHIREDDFNTHYKKCTDIRYICIQIRKYNIDFKPDEEEMRTYEDEMIKKMHRRVNEIVYEKTIDPIEKQILGKVLHNQEISLEQIKLGI